MGIKPALGWLGLLLFATAAQAEPSAAAVPTRWARALLVERQKPDPAPTVTPKTKAPPAAKVALAVLEARKAMPSDYETDGRAHMVFERQRRERLRIPKEAIRGVVRLAGGADQIDVIDTTGSAIVVVTAARESDVYVFAREATSAQRVAALETVPTRARERVKDALATAAKY